MSSSYTYDVAVIGSGPAGTMAAYTLAQAGYSTVIVEQKALPRYKTCGGGIVFRARNALPVDIGPVAEKEFYKATVSVGRHAAACEVVRDFPIITMTMRDRLDHFLAQAAMQAGATLLEKHKVQTIDFSEKNLCLHTNQHSIKARCAIAADGALSTVAKLAGWTETRHLIPALECEVQVPEEMLARLSTGVRFDIGFVPAGYAWVFPKRNHLSVGVLTTQRGKINLKAYYRQYLDFLGIDHIVSQSEHGYQIPVSPRKDGFFRNNVLLVGDAAGFADPVAAEGISNAILSGQWAADALIKGKLNPVAVQQRYHQKIHTELLPQLRIGRFWGSMFYQYAWFRNMLFRKNGQKFSEMVADIFSGQKKYPDKLSEYLSGLPKLLR